jgi:4-amino-4-deoxy-L-arabinose transferase-like glycosyltransferase
MQEVGRKPEDGTTARRCRRAAAALVLATLVLRLAYLAFACPLDLAPDEAHYWDWSRNPDWSYYSKGPGVAWLIRLSCILFGDLSTRWTGSEMLAVRLPAVICNGLLLVSLYVLTVQVCRRERLALLTVALAITTPVVSAGSSLMTIDSPYTCCWGWALVLAHRALFRPSRAAWWLTGAVVGLGILFKYTMVLWLPSLGLFLLLAPPYRRLLLSRHFWGMTCLAMSGLLPILFWNFEYDWVGFRHVSGQAGFHDDPKIHWFGPLQYVAVQCGLWLIFWFVVWVRAMWANAPWRAVTADRHYLWWMSATMFGVFLVFGFKTGGGEPNWPVAAYFPGIVLGVEWLVWQLRNAAGWEWRITAGGLPAACVCGVALTLLAHFSAWAHPLLAVVAGPPTHRHPYPLRRLDPTLRLRGWHELAAEVDVVRDQVRREEGEPVLATTGWNMPGLLGFYCAEHPRVYSLGLPLGDRWSQYDFWRPNPVWDPRQFAGRTFLVVTPNPLDLHEAFGSVTTVRVVQLAIHGQPIGHWVILLCKDYRGFRSTTLPATAHSF